MGDEAGKQNTVCREIKEDCFVSSDSSTLDRLTENSNLETISVFRTEMAWRDETRHQLSQPEPSF